MLAEGILRYAEVKCGTVVETCHAKNNVFLCLCHSQEMRNTKLTSNGSIVLYLVIAAGLYLLLDVAIAYLLSRRLEAV